jgi:hypothetical protein
MMGGKVACRGRLLFGSCKSLHWWDRSLILFSPGPDLGESEDLFSQVTFDLHCLEP